MAVTLRASAVYKKNVKVNNYYKPSKILKKH